MNSIVETLRGLGPNRLLAVGGVAAGLIGLLIFLTTRLTGPEMSLLYGELDPSDSSRIVSRLDGMKVPYQIQAGGTQILVPQDQVAKLRLTMAEGGIPSGGTIGYEVFDKADALTTTQTVQTINVVRALEGELARTIRSLNGVAAARVHLVMPKRELFNREHASPTASIVLKMRGATRLTRTQVQAIQHLVGAAVPGLAPTAVSIVDERGTLLARGNGDSDSAAVLLSASEEHRQAIEDRLRRVVEELIARHVGAGNVRAEITAEVDYDRVVENAEVFDPDGQVVRSTQTVAENGSSNEGKQTGSVSVANNLPEAKTADAEGGARSQSANARNEETVNYEISKTIRNRVRESGTIKRLSVAVLVNGAAKPDGQGGTQYAPREAEELEKLAALVRSAVGFDAARGDKVEVVNLPFAEAEAPYEPDPSLFGLGKSDYFKMAEILVLGVVGLLAVLLVLRPLVGRLLAMTPATTAADEAVPALAGPDAPAQIGQSGEMLEALPPKDEVMIDLAQVEGRVRESALNKIREIVEKHPDESLTVIRNWLHQEG